MTSRTIVFLISHTTPGGLRELWNDLARGFEARGHQVERTALYPPANGDDAAAGEEGWSYVVARLACCGR